jgi:TolA-binding protein
MAGNPLAALGRAVAGMGDDAVDARRRPSVEDRLVGLRAARARRRAAGEASLRGPVTIGLSLGAVAAAVILWPAPEPLTFAVGEPTTAGESGAWVVAPATGTVPLVFSDGTRVRLDGGARARVLGLSPRGARVAIERGGLRADVVPRAGNDWSFVGGPFEIHVTGTRFDAGWDPDSEVLHVTMREGRVVVRAACLDHERALVAGESASLSCGPPQEAPRPERGAAPAAPAIPTAAARAAGPPGGAAPPAASPSSAASEQAEPARGAASWRELARRGDYKGALAAAEAEDWGALCDSLSAADLLELGTTARLAGRGARAAEAYAAARRRFGGSDAAAQAAFHLGQMAFDGAHAFAEAHRWFSTYLAERPGGALAAEALGRAMEAEQRLGDLGAARETAGKYLARYPAGAHADLARSLLAP